MFRQPPPGATCGYWFCPVASDNGQQSPPRRCDRPAIVRLRAQNGVDIDLCHVCYEQQRCGSEPHWTDFPWVIARQS